MKNIYRVLFLFSFLSINAQVKNVLKVAIDPFHGGKDLGYSKSNKETPEKTINLIISEKIIELLNDKENIEILKIRNDDTFVPFNDKVYEANFNNANLYIAINCLESENPNDNGMSVFTLNKSDNDIAKKFAINENINLKKTKNYKNLFPDFNEMNPDSLFVSTKFDKNYLELSNRLFKVVLDEFAFNSLGNTKSFKGPFFLLHHVYMPSAIINVGYLTSEVDRKKLLNSEIQNKIALSIANAIIGFKNNLDNSKTDLNKILGKPSKIEEKKIAKDKNLSKEIEKNNLNADTLQNQKNIEKELAQKSIEDKLAQDKTEKEQKIAEREEAKKEIQDKLLQDKLNKEKNIAESQLQKKIAQEKLQKEKQVKIDDLKNNKIVSKNINYSVKEKELQNLLSAIEKAKQELSSLKISIDSSKTELSNILNNIEDAKEDYAKEKIKIENSKSYLLTLNKEILDKIKEIKETNKVSKIEISNINNTNSNANISSSKVIYNKIDLSNSIEKKYRIQVYACVICNKIPRKYIIQSSYNQFFTLREDGLNKFFIYEDLNKENAYLELQKIRDLGYLDAFMTCYIGDTKVKIE